MFKAITRENAHLHSDTIEAMFRLRHDVFIDRLGWDLNGQEGKERDQFDHDEAVYLVLENDRNQVVASARLLPTTSPYLLGDIFPQLTAPLRPPSSETIWEVTRVAVDHRKERHTCKNITNVSGALWCGLAEFGLAMNLSHFVSVSDLRLERILHRVGWVLRRLGDTVELDGVGVAGEVFSLSHEVLGNLRRKNSINGPVLNVSGLSHLLNTGTDKVA